MKMAACPSIVMGSSWILILSPTVKPKNGTVNVPSIDPEQSTETPPENEPDPGEGSVDEGSVDPNQEGEPESIPADGEGEQRR